MEAFGDLEKRLLRLVGSGSVHVDEGSFPKLSGKGDHFLLLESNSALGKREQCVISASLHVGSGVEFRAALANDDFSWGDCFASEGFDAEEFRLGIAAKLGRAGGFTMCHKRYSSMRAGYRLLGVLSSACYLNIPPGAPIGGICIPALCALTEVSFLEREARLSRWR